MIAQEHPAKQAREDLAAFFDELQELLQGAIFERPELFGDDAIALSAAWSRAPERFSVVEETLRGAVPSGVDLQQLELELERHGLTGEELELKLGLFRRAALDFLRDLSAQDEAERYWATWGARLRGSPRVVRMLAGWARRRGEEVRAAGRMLRRAGLKRALDAANVVVDSVALALSFVPPVALVAGAAASGIGELKSAAEVALDEPEVADKPLAPPRPAGASSLSKLEDRLGQGPPPPSNE